MWFVIPLLISALLRHTPVTQETLKVCSDRKRLHDTITYNVNAKMRLGDFTPGNTNIATHACMGRYDAHTTSHPHHSYLSQAVIGWMGLD